MECFWGGITLYWTTASKYTSSVNTWSKEFVPLSVVKNIFSVVNRDTQKKSSLRILQQVWKRKILRVTESSLLQCEEKKGAFWKQQYVIMMCLNVTVISGDKK